MHSPIMPIQGSNEPTLPVHGRSNPSLPAEGASPNTSSFAAELHSGEQALGIRDPGSEQALGVGDPTSEQALGIEDPPGAPPAEVLDQMETAGRICRQLLESGQRLRFSIQPEGGVKIELADHEGKMRAVSPTEALDIAAGKSLE